MKQIEVKVLNADAIRGIENTLLTAAALTQQGHKISSLEDFMALYDSKVNMDMAQREKTLRTLTHLPHPTLQKFGTINVVVVGASRRFLAQITRHQNEVKFMSASLQYSDYSASNNKTDFVVPYDMVDTQFEKPYIDSCRHDYELYGGLIQNGISNDSAGYKMPQGLRNTLIISATPFQWKHMIGQRICNRNTPETRYVMLKIWEELYKLSPLFAECGLFCMQDGCKEGKMSCLHKGMQPFHKSDTPSDILRRDFSKLYGDHYENK